MARIGLIGLGTMGANLALNIAEKGFEVAVHNRTTSIIARFLDEAGPLRDRLVGCDDLRALVGAVERPRTVILMVPAGEAVDAVIDALAPLLEAGDTIVDAGNADFNDTRRRGPELAERDLRFLGMGVSGGEEGARHGPSIMVGGSEEAYAPIRDVIEAIAARYQDTPCAALVGPDGAGHFVKTVHNGIEYGDMQLIADVYGLLRDGGGRGAEDIGELFATWNEGPLHSYLVEITAKVLAAKDEATGGPAVDAILDRAGQKGTGRWTLIEALKLGQSASVIEAAVAARAWSAMKTAREAGADLYGEVETATASPVLDADLEEALLAGRIIAYGQGFALLADASRAVRLGARPGADRRDLARRLHHPVGSAGRDRAGRARGAAARAGDVCRTLRAGAAQRGPGIAAHRLRVGRARAAGAGARRRARAVRNDAARARHLEPDPGAARLFRRPRLRARGRRRGPPRPLGQRRRARRRAPKVSHPRQAGTPQAPVSQADR